MAPEATFFPTYGFRAGSNWQIPVRVWLHTNHGLVERMLAELVGDFHNLEDPERRNFRDRMADFLSNDIKLKPVTIVFDRDQQQRQFPVVDEAGVPERTDLNGAIDGTILIPTAFGDQLLASSSDGWLDFHAADGTPGTGRVQLLEPTGKSVISDIDDTIKITGIPSGVKFVVRNTFFRNFAAVADMAERYRTLGAQSFHYVSGGPWQLYRPEADYLITTAGFPPGSFHLKPLDRNLISLATWESLEELAADRLDTKVATFKHKVLQITQLLTNFPQRKFILFGDSGEKDPEVYQLMRNEFPQLITEIHIRDVTNDRVNRPERLAEMDRIDAPQILPGVDLIPS
jgi:phosphatidate phosphatase APP1